MNKRNKKNKNKKRASQTNFGTIESEAFETEENKQNEDVQVESNGNLNNPVEDNSEKQNDNLTNQVEVEQTQATEENKNNKEEEINTIEQTNIPEVDTENLNSQENKNENIALIEDYTKDDETEVKVEEKQELESKLIVDNSDSDKLEKIVDDEIIEKIDNVNIAQEDLSNNQDKEPLKEIQEVEEIIHQEDVQPIEQDRQEDEKNNMVKENKLTEPEVLENVEIKDNTEKTVITDEINQVKEEKITNYETINNVEETTPEKVVEHIVDEVKETTEESNIKEIVENIEIKEGTENFTKEISNNITENPVEEIKTSDQDQIKEESNLLHTSEPAVQVNDSVKDGEIDKIADVIEYKKGEVHLRERVVESEDEDKSENAEVNPNQVVIKKLNLSALANTESEKRYPSLLKKPESNEKELISDAESGNSVSEYSVSVKEEEVQKIVLKVRVSENLRQSAELPVPIEQRLKSEHDKIFQENELNMDDSIKKIESQDELFKCPNANVPAEESPSPDVNDQPITKEASIDKNFNEVSNNFSEQISAGNQKKSKADHIRLIDEINIDKENDNNLDEIRKKNNYNTEPALPKTRNGVCSKCIIY